MPRPRFLAQRLRPALLAAVGFALPAAGMAATEAEPMPAAPKTWYTQTAFAVLKAVEGKQDPQAAAAAAVNSGLKEGVSLLMRLAPEWLRRSEIEVRLSDEFIPSYDVSTLQPLYRSSTGADTVFVQGRIAVDNRIEDPAVGTTGRARVGYRRLVYGDGILLGVNSFYDYDGPGRLRRLGVGAEVRSRAVEFTGRYYGTLPVPEPGERPAAAAPPILAGFDLDLSMQLPHLPWARVYGARFWRETDALGATTWGERFGLRLDPLPPVRLEFGGARGDRDDLHYFARLRYTRALGKPPEPRGPLIDHDAFAFGDASGYSLARLPD